MIPLKQPAEYTGKHGRQIMSAPRNVNGPLKVKLETDTLFSEKHFFFLFQASVQVAIRAQPAGALPPKVNARVQLLVGMAGARHSILCTVAYHTCISPAMLYTATIWTVFFRQTAN